MRFPVSFTRYKGTVPADGIALGADSAPTNVQPGRADNGFSHLPSNVSGWPAQRIAMVCKYTGAGSPIALPVQVYFWEALTERWYAFGSSVNITPNGALVFFDTVCAMEYIGPQQAQDMPRPGGEDLLFVVTDPGAAPDGAYMFALCADLSTSGTGP